MVIMLNRFLVPFALLVPFLLCSLPVRAQSDAGYSVKFLNPPASLAVNRKVTLRVYYQAPEAGTTLNIELKLEPGAQVSAATHKQVAGAGNTLVTFTIPQSAADQNMGFAGWLGSNWQHPYGAICRTSWTKVLSAAEAEKRAEQTAADQQGLEAFLKQYPFAPGARRIGLYQFKQSAWSGRITEDLGRRLAEDGFTSCPLTGGELANRALLVPKVLPALALVDSTTIPAAAVEPIADYVRAGGFLISLGGPAFSKLLFRVGGSWMNRADCLRRLGEQLDVHPLFLPKRTQGWRQATSSPDKPSSLETVLAVGLPAPVQHAYRLKIDLNGWCTFYARSLVVPAGDKLTVFWAKGDKNASSLAVEWDERDGSRWIAVVGLTTQWKRYVLPKSAFLAWPDPPVAGRFFPGDHLHLTQGCTLGFGLANGFTSEPSGQRYTLYVAGVGTAAMPAGPSAIDALVMHPPSAMPAIDTVSPAYKLFPVTNMKTLAVNRGQAMAPKVELPAPAAVLGIYPRAQGAGLDKDLAVRFVPLLESHDVNGRFTATLAALELPSAGAAAHQATLLSIPVTDPTFFEASATQQWLAATIEHVQRGLYLAEGGTKEFASFGEVQMPIGAVVANAGSQPQLVAISCEIADAQGIVAFTQEFHDVVQPGTRRKFEASWSVPAAGPGIYHVRTVLKRHGNTIDRLSHEFRILPPAAHPDFVTARNGQFYLDGRPWYVYGVNFWPESSMAQENGHLYENWLSRQSYDPQTVERNLHDVKAMGFNTISIAYHAADGAWNLMDVLDRARALSLKVNLSISGIDGLAGARRAPGKFTLEPVRQLITECRLAPNDTLFAYDIAWEPFWDNHAARRRLDPQWRRWIVKHYGSLAKAQAAWHGRAPRENGQVSNPFDSQIAQGRRGPAAAMVLAYNRFLKSVLVNTYGSARRRLRSVDPNHFVSFRMRAAGDPSQAGDIMYDLADLGHAVDIFEPEGYGLMNSSPLIVRRALFTIQYARAVNPNPPVIYAEFGQSEWNRLQDADSSEVAAETGKIYAAFYQAILEAGGNGAICWWFPGGFRCGERSDFGIINPDRSWRPVSYVIHDFAARMTTPRPLPKPDVVIPISPQTCPGGASEVFREIQPQWTRLVQEGKLPGFRWHHRPHNTF